MFVSVCLLFRFFFSFPFHQSVTRFQSRSIVVWVNLQFWGCNLYVFKICFSFFLNLFNCNGKDVFFFCLETVCFLWSSAALYEVLYLVVPLRFLCLLFSQNFCENPFPAFLWLELLWVETLLTSLQLIFLLWNALTYFLLIWRAIILWKWEFVICGWYSFFRCQTSSSFLMGGKWW